MIRNVKFNSRYSRQSSTSRISRFLRPSKSRYGYLIGLLVVFLVSCNMFQYSVVSMIQKRAVETQKEIPDIVLEDKKFAIKLTRELNSIEQVLKYYPESDYTLQNRTLLTVDSDDAPIIQAGEFNKIHFNEKLPLNDPIIERQANLTIANFKTKSLQHKISTLQKTREKIKKTEENSLFKESTQAVISSKLKVAPLKPVIDDKTILKMKGHHEIFYKNNQKYYNDLEKTNLPKQQKAVFLQTNYRSGSTFLGQLFNQHPDVFYTFEPLFMFKDDTRSMRQLMCDVIKNNLECNIRPAVEIFDELKWSAYKDITGIQCLLNNMCFRQKTLSLCGDEMCPTRDKRNSCSACGPLNINKVNHFCRQHKVFLNF